MNSLWQSWGGGEKKERNQVKKTRCKKCMLDNSYIVFTLVSADEDINEVEGSSGQQ